MMIQEKYINPFTDFGFKRLFGEEANKELLIDFLNSFLPQKHQIAELTFRNPNYIGMIESERNAFFDIFCKAHSGEYFIVEMQKAKHNFFRDRSLFYVSYPIREEAQKGSNWTFELPTVYFFAILDFKIEEKNEREKVLREVMLKDQDCEVFYEKLRFVFIQMPSFRKTLNELTTHQDKWLYFLKYLPSFEYIPEILKEPVFEHAFEVANLAALSQEDYMVYEQSLLKYAEIRGVVETAFGEGEQLGLQKGEQLGLQKGELLGQLKKAIETAQNLKKLGVLNIEQIAQVTGLSHKEVEEL